MCNTGVSEKNNIYFIYAKYLNSNYVTLVMSSTILVYKDQQCFPLCMCNESVNDIVAHLEFDFIKKIQVKLT